MIVRILSSAANFDGVNYNTSKVERSKGILMKVSGFGPLQGLEVLRPEDYKNYLKMISAQNKRVAEPQFHAVISAKGWSSDKDALAGIAVSWLGLMGYGEQPYIIVYHKDTRNNHVHMVSTRIGKDGKKINSGFEHNRAIQNLNKVLGIDEAQTVKLDIERALGFQFRTRAQFKMILEQAGYVVKEAGEQLAVIKFGARQAEINLSLIDDRISQSQLNQDRLNQLKAIFYHHGSAYDTALKAVFPASSGREKDGIIGYTSDFSVYLSDKLGVQLIYHFKDDKLPYGYSMIDHPGKAVYKGSDVLPLHKLLAIRPEQNQPSLSIDEPVPATINDPDPETRAYYTTLLSAALHHYADPGQGLRRQGLEIRRVDAGLILVDPVAAQSVPVNAVSNDSGRLILEQYYGSGELRATRSELSGIAVPGIQIAADIDDEAIYGRNRRRKKKARTNSR